MTSAIDLERKMQEALAARLKQQPLLARIRARYTSEDSPKVNQDLIVTAKRGEGNPPYSGVHNMDVSVSLSMKFGKSATTLPQFLKLCAAMEEVFNLSNQFQDVGGYPRQVLAIELSSLVPNFHCYELLVTGKDDSPEDNRHKCVWALSGVAMCQTYDNAVSVNS